MGRQCCNSLSRYFPQGILASTLASKLTRANYHILGMVARAGVCGSCARNANAATSSNIAYFLLCVGLERALFLEWA